MSSLSSSGGSRDGSSVATLPWSAYAAQRGGFTIYIAGLGNATFDAISMLVNVLDTPDRAAIREALAGGKRPVVTLHAEVDTGWRKAPILVCDLNGPGGPVDPFMLLSGHHDTWYHGVMDNGSVNADMLEVARLLAQHRGTWRRGMRVCFWSGYSHGRYSSSAWCADEHWDGLDRRCVAHVNVDSLGGTGVTVLANTKSTAEWLAPTSITVETPQSAAFAELAVSWSPVGSSHLAGYQVEFLPASVAAAW